MTDQPQPETVPEGTRISRYVITNETDRRVSAEVSQWGVMLTTERDIDTTQALRQSVFLDWSEGELIQRIINKHTPK